MFTLLRQCYPTWDALKSYLTSEAGGKFSIRDYGNTHLAIILYKRNETVLRPDTEWLRSVVWNTKTHLPVCVAPKKANEGMPPTQRPLCVEEFYDGVMINVFRTLGVDEGKEQMATRSQLGAGGTFYSKKSFKELAEEANVSFRLDTPTEEAPSHFVSYVLQHPEHRVVAYTSKPRMIPVESGAIMADGTVVYESFPHSLIESFADETAIHAHLRAESILRGWRWQGLVFRDGAGNRWRLRSPTYTYLRKLRGNEAKPLDRFLRLRADKAVTEYLKHYGEERQIFWNFETTLRMRTKDIYDAYIAVHKSHEKKLADLVQPDKTVVFKLHSHFLSQLREQGKTVRMEHVKDLINALPLWEQALLCNERPVTETPVSEHTAPMPPAN